MVGKRRKLFKAPDMTSHRKKVFVHTFCGFKFQLYLFQSRGHRVHDILLVEPLPAISSLVVVVDTKLQLWRELHEGHVMLQTAHLWMLPIIYYVISV